MTQPSETQELKPCPFCQREVRAIPVQGAGYSLVGCNDLNCPASSVSCYPNEWNTRAPVDSQGAGAAPIDMVLFCPRCGTQHVDAPEDETTFRHRMEVFSLVAEPQDHFPSRWTNPPHKSHLCHNCGAVWRPADAATNGVAQIATRGKNDNIWTNGAAVPATAEFDAATQMRTACLSESLTLEVKQK